MALMESLLGRVRELEPSLKSWVTLEPERALEAAHQAEQALQQEEPVGLLLGSRRGQGHLLHCRDQNHGLLSSVRRLYPRLRRHGGGAAQGGGRHRAGQDRHHRVRLRRSPAHGQPLECSSHARRLQQRLSRGRGSPDVPRCPGLPDRGLPLCAPPSTTALWGSSPPMDVSASMASSPWPGPWTPLASLCAA